MPQRWRARLALTSAAAGVACLAFATPGWALATTSVHQSSPAALAPGSDPAGANGTVKIDGLPYDSGIDNEPHVTCDFQVAFFNFDQQEHANIVFTVQPPTGPGAELLRRDNVLVSTDPASGGKPDPDATFAFSTSELGLDSFTPHPKQGYHIKLTVERIGAPGAGKHKVFWVQACPQSPPPSSPPPTGGGGDDDSGSGGGLPLTGIAVSGIALLGSGLLAGGATLVVLHRRRKTIFTS